MSIYDNENVLGPLPSKYQRGETVKFRGATAVVSAVEFHKDGKVVYLVEHRDGEFWANSVELDTYE